jgi:hypothetical protein
MLYTASLLYQKPDAFNITLGIFSYKKPFRKKMQESYKEYTHFWKEVVDISARTDLTLVCACKEHRIILASEYLQKCGATYKGER